MYWTAFPYSTMEQYGNQNGMKTKKNWRQMEANGAKLTLNPTEHLTNDINNLHKAVQKCSTHTYKYNQNINVKIVKVFF